MREALNRTVNNGDVVVVKKGKYGADFEIGVAWGKSVILKDGLFSSYSTFYLIENPTEYERSTADSILEAYNKRKAEEKAEKPKRELTPLKDIKPGNYGFLTKSNEISAYLGKCDIVTTLVHDATLTPKQIKDRYTTVESKHAYVSLGYGEKSAVVVRCMQDGNYDKDIIGTLGTYNTSIVKNKKAFRKDGILGNLKLPDSVGFKDYAVLGDIEIVTAEYKKLRQGDKQ